MDLANDRTTAEILTNSNKDGKINLDFHIDYIKIQNFFPRPNVNFYILYLRVD